jgi:multidrug efflux pump subunit AcrA (membrane-fusion protein)
VFQASGALDEATRTRLTEIRLPNPKRILLPGMYAQVSITPLDASHGSIRVPANTLLVDAKGQRVAVVGPDNTVHFREVRLGRDYGQETEILSGVGLDDRLITDPSDELHEGSRVEIISK